jgi:hypothetical protein
MVCSVRAMGPVQVQDNGTGGDSDAGVGVFLPVLDELACFFSLSLVPCRSRSAPCERLNARPHARMAAGLRGLTYTAQL